MVPIFFPDQGKIVSIICLRTFILMCVGSDAILLGAETLRGFYPVETISTVRRICAEVIFLCV